MNLNALMHRIAKGEGEALNSFALTSGQRLFRTAYRLLADHQRAEDAVQDTFIKIWQKAPLWKDVKGSAYTWSYQILTHICLDMLRAQKKSVSLDEVFLQEDLEVLEKIELALDRLLLARAFEKLDKKQRVCIVLICFEGMTNKESAQIMGIGVKAVESHLVRARRALKNYIQAQEKGNVS